LPDDVTRAHHDWLRRTRGWYKAVLGSDGRLHPPDLPPGEPSVPLELVPRVYQSIRELILRHAPARGTCCLRLHGVDCLRDRA
jgi:hypothetical protein